MTKVVAAAYLRMSTDDQTTSIGIQKREIVRAFGERYDIHEWYVDAGRSGSHSADKRVEFLRLLEDAEKQRFEVVLCYDLSRFTRLDNIEAAFAKKVLRDNGIRLVTVMEGEFDWTTSTGRIVDSVLTEAQHEYSVKLSKRVIDGKKAAFERKEGVPGQVTPYGYARLVTDSNGNQRVVPRTERFERPRGWHQTLVPGDEHEVEIVRWIFTEFNTRDVSFHRLAEELNEKGVPSPTGRRWNYQTIHDILTNVRYAGDLSFGKNASGKHHRLVNGEIVKNNDPRSRNRKKDGYLVERDTHEALVSRALFESVQVKVRRRWRTGKHASRDFALTGVLYCGHCGKPLYGNDGTTRSKSAKGVRYNCKGIHRGSGCGQWGVKESDILPFIINTVIEQIDRKMLLDAQIKLPTRRNGDATGLKRKLAKLKATYEQGLERFLSLPSSSMANDLQDKLEAMKQEIVSLETEIARQETPEPWDQVFARRSAVLRELKGKLVTVQTATACNGKYGTGVTMQRAALRELLHRAEVRVDLWFRRVSPHRYGVARGRLRVGNQIAELDIDAAQNENLVSLIV